jgi:hypothetical protein
VEPWLKKDPKTNKLIPGQPLIYERANGVVYAKYRDPPYTDIPRWVIGGDPGAVARAQGRLLDYSEWLELCDLVEANPTLKKLMDQLITTYYIIKDDK